MRCCREGCGKVFLLSPGGEEAEGKKRERFLRDRLTRATYACDMACAGSSSVRARLRHECARRHLHLPEGVKEEGGQEQKDTDKGVYGSLWKQIVR